MPEPRLLSFEPFRLDVPNAQLWCGQEVIRLTSKALDVGAGASDGATNLRPQ
ncbi:MAG TPA: hypothetical protein VKK81_01235 [Candidatus Binatia bacterium]|nr:hypothetical protein [Candidatus Binatia bacterium]